MTAGGRALFLYERKGVGGAASLFPGLWRLLLCLLLLVVLLAVRVSAAAEDGGDPPDPDYGGTADQDPANQGWGDQDDGIALQDFSNTDSSTLTNIKNKLDNIYTWMTGTADSVQDSIQSNTYNTASRLSTANTHLSNVNIHLTNIQNALFSGGVTYGQLNSIDTRLSNSYTRLGTISTTLTNVYDRLGNIYDRLGNLRTDVQNVDSSVKAQTKAIDDNHAALTTQLQTQHNALLFQMDVEYKGRTQQLDQHHDALMEQLGDIEGFMRGDYSKILRPVTEIPYDQSNGFYYRPFFRTSPSSVVNPVRTSDGGLTMTSSLSSVTEFGIEYTYNNPRDIGPLFLPGKVYRVLISWAGSCSSFSTYLDKLIVSPPVISTSAGRVTVVFTFSPSAIFFPTGWYFPVSATVSPGPVYYSFILDSSDSIDHNFSSSVNQGQAAATDQLQSEIDKSEAFESQIFEDVNRYTKQLDFGLSDWGEAASGISYISSIFMMVWNNSPKQPIILSLMLGLCMLLLGRGARLAGEVRKANDRAERSQRRTKGG